ncbi:hypothetical protein AX15_001266 [Amanita polypyramis BW_CC]|nr:hypothetical protein AX15_001266 [Amanita polypyramis BW_CC]
MNAIHALFRVIYGPDTEAPASIPTIAELLASQVELSSDIPVVCSSTTDILKGRYRREDVMISVLRFVEKDETNTETIKRKVELWSRIFEVDRGEHILPIYGFYFLHNRFALVNPWMENQDALTYVKKNDRLINYKNLIRSIGEGIRFLHTMNPPIVHGGLKAEKIYIGDKAQPLIKDSTLVRAEGEIDITLTSGDSDSYRWHAPELLEEACIITMKNDIYSFGMTILELLTHSKPYAEIGRASRVVRIVRNGGEPNRPSDVRAEERGLDDNMWDLLCTCWSFDPKDRPSIDELLAKL